MSMLNSMHGSSQVYSESYWRPITGVAMIISCMVLAAMCSHRWPGWRWDDWRSLTLPKIAILLVLVDSLAFVFAATFMTLGLGTSFNNGSCEASIWLCILLYSTEKVFITFFLVERAHIVHGQVEPRRHHNTIYRINSVLIAVWFGIFFWLIARHKTHLATSDNSCHFYIDRWAALTAGMLDIVIITYLSVLFAWPLWRGRWASHDIRRLAFRSLIAGLISLVSTSANLMWTTFGAEGHQLSWLCYTLCTLDCLVNAAVLFAITSNDSANPARRGPSRPLTDPSLAFPSSTGTSSTAARRRTAGGAGAISVQVDAYSVSEVSRLGDGLKLEVEEGEKEGVPVGLVEDDPASWRGDVMRVGVGRGEREASAPKSGESLKEV